MNESIHPQHFILTLYFCKWWNVNEIILAFLSSLIWFLFLFLVNVLLEEFRFNSNCKCLLNSNWALLMLWNEFLIINAFNSCWCGLWLSWFHWLRVLSTEHWVHSTQYVCFKFKSHSNSECNSLIWWFGLSVNDTARVLCWYNECCCPTHHDDTLTIGLLKLDCWLD